MAIALSGCVTPLPMPPAAEVPVIEIPPAWSAANAAGAGTLGINSHSLAAWWQRFDDPLMSDLIKRAMLFNTSVNSAEATLLQAEATREVTAAALKATLTASASAQRGTSGGDSTGTSLQAGLSAQWLPDVFGARRSALDAANSLVAFSAASLADTRVQVASEVALNYILLRSAQARANIARDNLASQLETRQITIWRQQAGLVTLLEVEQARAAAAQTQAFLPTLQTSIQQGAHTLAVQVGLPPATLQLELGVEQVSRTTNELALATALPESELELVLAIPAETLRQRADVRAAEYQVAAALARVRQAEAQRLPSFSVTGSIGLSAVSIAALSNGASVISSLLASVSWPVLDGGAARAQVLVQQAALAQARQTYRAAVLAALKDVENALVTLSNDRQRLASLRVAAEAARNAAVLARLRYSSGLVDFQTVLETQRNQLSTEDGVVSARADVGRDQVRLFTALGGGWRT